MNRSWKIAVLVLVLAVGLMIPGCESRTEYVLGAVLPLSWDVFTDVVMLLLNTAMCQNFLGNLDGLGTATATLDTLGPLDPALVDVTVHFACALGWPFDFASNAIPVTFEP